jgi:hypothetical protein
VLESPWWALEGYLLNREVQRESSQRRIDDLEQTNLLFSFHINIQRNEDLRSSRIHTICSSQILHKVIYRPIYPTSHSSSTLISPSSTPRLSPIIFTPTPQIQKGSPMRPVRPTSQQCYGGRKPRRKPSKTPTCHIVIGQTFVARRMGNPRRPTSPFVCMGKIRANKMGGICHRFAANHS